MRQKAREEVRTQHKPRLLSSCLTSTGVRVTSVGQLPHVYWGPCHISGTAASRLLESVSHQWDSCLTSTGVRVTSVEINSGDHHTMMKKITVIMITSNIIWY